jgi:hypothetical protein
MTLIAVYLAAIVAANLAIASFGPSAAILVAFLFIGLDMAARDRLHDRWHDDHLVLRMGALIAAGGLISWALNAGAGQIALASTVAFTLSAVVDALIFAALGERSYFVRVNGSNVVSSAVDSLTFPTIAFGAFLPLIVLGQFTAKVVGGFLWSLILAVPLRRRAA